MVWRDFTDSRLTWESLIRQALVVLLPFFVAAILWQTFGPGFPIESQARLVRANDGVAAAERHIVDHLNDQPDDEDAWWALVRNRHEEARLDHVTMSRLPVAEVRALVAAADVPDRDLLLAFLVLEDEGIETALAGFADRGDLTAVRVRWELALRGGDVTTAESAARRWFELEPCRASADAMLALADDPETAEQVRRLATPSRLMFLALARDDMLAAIWHGIRSKLDFEWPDLVVALVIGLLWILFLLNFGVVSEWLPAPRLGVPLAFLLGIASLAPALAIIIPMDHGLELRSGGYVASAIYSLAIGVREECVKLLLFLPLLPWARRWTSVQALIVASVVGLGFAVGENVDYYQMNQGHSVFGRFVTANFLHLTLTGLVGHALVQAVQGRLHWEDFLSRFGFVILAHAAYDYVLIEPLLADYAIVSMIIFIVISQRYLRLLQTLRPERRLAVAPTRLFLTCLATSVGFHYLLVAANLGYVRAIPATGSDVVGAGILIIMYFREFGERIE